MSVEPRLAPLFVSVMLAVPGVIHLLPVVGVFGARRVESLYGVVVHEPTLELLLRHRAVNLGLLGAVFLLAAVRPPVQWLAFGAGCISIASFVWLARSIEGLSPLAHRVALIDWVALACLLAGAAVRLWLDRRRQG